MRAAEILRENPSTDLLAQLLQTVASNADADGMPVFVHFNGIKNPRPNSINLDLNKLTDNAGAENFGDMDSINAAYEQDLRIQNIIKSIEQDGIELETENSLEPAVTPSDQEATDNRMNQAAMSAATAPDPNAAAAATAAQTGISQPG